MVVRERYFALMRMFAALREFAPVTAAGIVDTAGPHYDAT
jgi:hypothetical protein